MAEDLRTVRENLTDTASFIKRHPHATKTFHSNALKTFSDTLRRPRLSIATFALGITLALIALWGVMYLVRPSLHQPKPEAARWYEIGVKALRDGAYYQASRALEESIKVDDKYALAHARLAEAYAELDYTDKAKDELLRISMLVPDRTALPQVDALYFDAINSLVANDAAQAVEDYTQIAELMPERAEVYVDLGRAYEKNEDIDNALKNYVEATRHDAQYATAYLRAGILYSRKQDVASANNAFDKAESLYQALGNIEGLTVTLRQRGILLKKIGKFPEARAQLEQSLTTARAANNEQQQIYTLLELSNLSYAEGATAQAEKYATEGVNFAQQHGLENLATNGLIDLGNAYLARGNYDRAEKYFKEALDFARRNKARLHEAISLMNLGSVYIQQLRTDDGLPLVEQALAFFQRGNYRSRISACLTFIGRANRRKGDYDAALRAFNQKLQLAEQGHDQSQIAFSHSEIAMVLLEQERYVEALSQYEQSYAIRKSSGEQLSVAFNLLNQSNILTKLGRFSEARSALTQATAIASQPNANYKSLIAEAPLRRAELALFERRFSEASSLAKQAISLSGTQYIDTTISAKYTLGLAQALLGAAREGKQLCAEAVQMAQGTGDTALLSRAMLALAETTLESDDARGALTQALVVQERFARAGQLESEWRAWLIASRASQRLKDTNAAQEQLARAADTLSKLRQLWGAEAFDKYLARPDIQILRKELGDAFVADNIQPR
jgi:tetratricopeptide (TPR) repeat protein